MIDINLPFFQQRLQRVLYPALTDAPAAQRDAVLRAARTTSFDLFEWLGILMSLGVSAYVLERATNLVEIPSYFLRFILAFICAVPTLALLSGPFLLRRTRRGLKRELSHLMASDGQHTGVEQ